MNELILHHYPASPYSEKIRLILGFKKLDYISVVQPEIMPKPDQIALTGGYRKAPVLQVGAHIYCDTALIADFLEKICPQPTLFPEGSEGSQMMIANHAEQMIFRIAGILVFQPQGENVQKPFGLSRRELMMLLKDRIQLMKDSRVPHIPSEFARAYLEKFLNPLDLQLQKTKSFICHNTPGLADFSLYMSIWFLLNNPNTKDQLEQFSNILDWYAAMSKYRKPAIREMTPAQAIEVAKNNPPKVNEGDQIVNAKLKKGDLVEIRATDYGFEPVRGELVCLDSFEMVVCCRDERAGLTHVHFPIMGYEINLVK